MKKLILILIIFLFSNLIIAEYKTRLNQEECKYEWRDGYFGEECYCGTWLIQIREEECVNGGGIFKIPEINATQQISCLDDPFCECRKNFVWDQATKKCKETSEQELISNQTDSRSYKRSKLFAVIVGILVALLLTGFVVYRYLKKRFIII